MGTRGRVAGRITRGDVRLYRFSPPDKKRPVVVLTRDSILPHLSTATVAPVSSTIRGVASEVVLDERDGMKGPCAVNLHNAITVLQQRLGRRVAQLSSLRMNQLCSALHYSLGCDGAD
ncbi:MAG TPA: type II toxin-antitoxin system PemK/MazF family toxin [Bryobacteraceae bacterium]|nr:type II toxin-antitoxin system PemK/MazF family toxin [Bryobacteraceae bacterium]